MTKNANLKQLLPNTHPAEEYEDKQQHWWFNGSPMTPEQAKDFPAADFMPDGRLKLAKFRIGWRQKRLPVSTNEPDLREQQEERWQEYQELTEPRPDYMEWAAQRSRREMFDELEVIARLGRTSSERSRAIGTILEFTKMRPKQQHELSQAPEPVHPMTPEELLEFALQVNNLTHADVASMRKN